MALVVEAFEVGILNGFVMDWSGATSRGKTSALRVGASIWGDPDRVVGSWGTAVRLAGGVGTGMSPMRFHSTALAPRSRS